MTGLPGASLKRPGRRFPHKIGVPQTDGGEHLRSIYLENTYNYCENTPRKTPIVAGFGAYRAEIVASLHGDGGSQK